MRLKLTRLQNVRKAIVLFHHRAMYHQVRGHVPNAEVRDTGRNHILMLLVQGWLLIIILVAQVALSVVEIPIITIIAVQSVNVINLL